MAPFAIPLPYVQGSSVTLRLQSTGEPLTAYIDHIFEVTKSQTFKVHFAPSDSDSEVSTTAGLPLPRQAILKFFDWRYINDREPQTEGDQYRLWDPVSDEEVKAGESERARIARAKWRAIASGEARDDSGDVIVTEGPFTGQMDWEVENDARTSHPAYEEEGFRRMCIYRYQTELTAYERLEIFQGISIPRCFGSVIVPDPPGPKRAAEDPQIYGLILEYIDGATLGELVAQAPDEFTQLGFVPHNLLEVVSAMGSHGVIHGDIRLENILVTPTRAYLIDFGHATLRSEDMSDAEWNDEVDNEEDEEAVRQLLRRYRVRDVSPIFPLDGYIGMFNKDVQQYFEERWRNRWYDDMSLNPDSPSQPDFEGKDAVQRWVLKPEVQAWLDARPPAPERYRHPRPGSPGLR